MNLKDSLYKNKYLKYKKKYIDLKNQIGGVDKPEDELQSALAESRRFVAREAAGESKKPQSPAVNNDFLKYPIFGSRTNNNFFGDSARGDGFCSIWAVLVGWSLLGRDELIRNTQFLGDVPQPTTIQEVIEILKNTGKILLDIIGEETNFKFEGLNFSKGELEIMKWQLDMDPKKIQRIQGRSQFQIMAMLLGVEIQILDKTTNNIDIIGNKENDTIRITTNGIHYHVHNNTQDGDLTNFTNRFWWNLQWQNHPHIEDPKQVEPYIPS